MDQKWLKEKEKLLTDPVEFDGDIIITDPGYLIKKDCDDKDYGQDYDALVYGDNPDRIGITACMARSTIYGDWSCTTFNTDTSEPIGKFCADGGMVGVYLLDEILRYNPEYNDHTDKPWTTTWIKDFKGSVQFVVTREEGVYSETTEYCKADEVWEDYSVHVVGHGVNKQTGEPINFITHQTGL